MAPERRVCRIAERGPGSCRVTVGTTVALAAAALLVGAAPAAGQNQRLQTAAREANSRAVAAKQAAQRAAIRQLAPGAVFPSGRLQAMGSVARQARELMMLFLREGMRQPYAGTQVTRLLQAGGRVRETQQTVKYAGPGRMRIDYTSPPALRGEVILIAGGRFYHYRPGRATILDGVATPGAFQTRVRELQQGIRKGTVQVRMVGQEQIAGRSAGIVEIRSQGAGAFYLKFWIDEQTGVRLKHANLDPQGSTVTETYFTSIDYSPQFGLAEFGPGTLPNLPHEPLLPEAPPLPSVKEAQAQVGYTIREPAVPSGFHASGIWVVPGMGSRRTTIFRYTDGVNTVALFESPRPLQRANPASAPLRASRNGVAHWATGDMAYALIGNLRPEDLRTMADSLR